MRVGMWVCVCAHPAFKRAMGHYFVTQAKYRYPYVYIMFESLRTVIIRYIVYIGTCYLMVCNVLITTIIIIQLRLYNIPSVVNIMTTVAYLTGK